MEFLKKYWAVILVILAVLIIAIMIYKKLRKPVNAEYVEGGGNVNTFNPQPITQRMFDVIDGVFTLAGTKNEAAQAFSTLNDNQVIAVYNDWNNRFYSKNNETLTQAMKNEVNTPAVVFGANYWQELIDRLTRLNLN